MSPPRQGIFTWRVLCMVCSTSAADNGGSPTELSTPSTTPTGASRSSSPLVKRRKRASSKEKPSPGSPRGTAPQVINRRYPGDKWCAIARVLWLTDPELFKQTAGDPLLPRNRWQEVIDDVYITQSKFYTRIFAWAAAHDLAHTSYTYFSLETACCYVMAEMGEKP